MPTYVAHAPGEQPPGADPMPPPPSVGSGDGAQYREHFFGTLAPTDKTISVHEHTWVVRLRILELEESRRCAAFAYERSKGHVESDDYLIAQTIARIAFMLQAVDGKPIDEECRTLDQRVQLAASLYDTLADAIIDAYNELRDDPILFLGEMVADADFADTPTDTGSSSVGEDSPQAG